MKHFCILSLLLLGFASFSQDIQTEPLESRALNADAFFGIDTYKNTYTVTDRTLYKKGTQGDHQYAALNLGKITSVDILNPLKIAVFYRNANTVVILDNTLNEIRRVNFSDIDSFRNLSHASTAGDRRLWIFNTDLQQLEVFDYNQEKVITQFLPMDSPGETQATNFNFCWIGTAKNLHIFNVYGSLIETIPLEKRFDMLIVENDNLIGLRGNELFFRDAQDLEFKKIEIPEITIKQFSFKDEILYIYDGQHLMIRRLKPSKK